MGPAVTAGTLEVGGDGRNAEGSAPLGPRWRAAGRIDVVAGEARGGRSTLWPMRLGAAHLPPSTLSTLRWPYPPSASIASLRRPHPPSAGDTPSLRRRRPVPSAPIH
uniref:Uncharacterized protein n=1 Tax=Oryza brachyantha TaxID=4533 RepID=J3N817_ORYBR